ncbi:MAG: LysR substrate-binding domain-containing protein [Pseudomonadota bacterium]
MKSLPLNALRALAAVYLSGGIRPASRMLGVAHSSVARHLSEVEARLGARVIDKGGVQRAVAFTALGERLARDATTAMSKLDEAWEAASERRTPHAVVISAPPSVAALWLLPRLPALAEAHPRIEVSVLAEQRVRGPQEDGADIAIRMGAPRSGEPAEPLMDDALVPVVSPRLLARAKAARGGPTGSNGVSRLLRDLPLLHDRDPNAGWDRWVAAFGPSDLDVGQGPRFGSSDLVLRAAQQGQGIALARLRLAEDALTAGTVVRLSEDCVPLPMAYQLIGRADGNARHAVRTVWRWLRDTGRRADGSGM